MNKTEPMISKRYYNTLIASIIVTILGYLGFSLWGGFTEVVFALKRISIAGIPIMLSLSMVNYILRFYRWQNYLNKMGHNIPLLDSWRIYLTGFALTTTPGKAGEALRGIFLKKKGVPYTKSLAAFFSERLSDLFAIVILALMGISTYERMSGIIVFASLCIIGILMLLASRRFISRLADWGASGTGRIRFYTLHIANLLEQARLCHNPRLLALTTTLSMAAWIAEALALYCLFLFLNIDLPFLFAVFVYAVSMLAGAISFLPGGLGSTEAVMASLLMWGGIALPESIAITMLIRLTTLWFAVFLGISALAMSRESEKT